MEPRRTNEFQFVARGRRKKNVNERAARRPPPPACRIQLAKLFRISIIVLTAIFEIGICDCEYFCSYVLITFFLLILLRFEIALLIEGKLF